MTRKASPVMSPRYTLMMVISTSFLVFQHLPSTDACMCMKPDFEREFAKSDYAIVINVIGQVKSYSPIQLRDLTKRKSSASSSSSNQVPSISSSLSPLISSSSGSRSSVIFPKSSSQQQQQQQNQQHYIPSSITNYPSMPSFSNLFLSKNPNSQSTFYFPDSKSQVTFTPSHHPHMTQYSSSSNTFNSYAPISRPYPYAMFSGYRASTQTPSASANAVASAVIARREQSGETNGDTIEREGVQVSSTGAPTVQYEELERLFSFTPLNRVILSESKVNQVLANGVIYTNPRTSCYPNLKANTKYLIWGRVDFMQRIFITACSSIEYDSLDNEEIAIIDKFIQSTSSSSTTLSSSSSSTPSSNLRHRNN